jgi:Putative Ig domain/Subtilase family
VRRVVLTRQAVAVAAVAAAGIISVPAIAAASAAAPGHAASLAALAGQPARPALPPGEHYVCPPATAGHMTCMSIVRTAASPTAPAYAGGAAAPQTNGAYLPSDLRKAYRVATYAAHNGRGRTVAIVDAYADPHAASDLAKYRRTFHLPPCTTSSGCLHIYNGKGASKPLPRVGRHWAIEESLDLDMVSAVCPLCHIDLIEAWSNSNTNLGMAENTAARKARFVSNSWGGSEFPAENRDNHFYNHPGHVIAFAAGDAGYGSSYPASLQLVTSVGGTSLRHSANNRGWTESVWGTAANTGKQGTASGCSRYEAKPSWQRADIRKAGACTRRTENDAAAVADPNTGVVIYISVTSDVIPRAGFYVIGGTSAATPIVTAIYALAGNPVVNTYPAQYPYLKARNLFDVTTGANGLCGTYLCRGESGFDGPTGLGTPNGIAGFRIRAVRRVTLVDPGTIHATVGHSLTAKIIGLDTRKVSQLRWSWTGQPSVPAGLSIHAIPHSTNGQITGKPTAPGTYSVVVTARDGTAFGRTYFTIIVS